MLFTGLIVLIIAGVFQGSYGIGMKKYEPFSWEAMWAVFSILGMIITPVIWTAVEVPHFTTYLFATPVKDYLIAALCGFFWGITAIGYGRAIDYVGLSLTNGIAYGVSAAVGSIFPLFTGKELPDIKFMIGLILGDIIMITGVAIISKAGIMKDKESKASETAVKNPKFNVGLILAIIAGFGSAAQNVGFTYANTTCQLAVADGINATAASNLGWIVVLSGGFIANFGYAIYLLVKNHNFGNFTAKGCGVGYAKAAITGILWFAALGIYGKATVLLGEYGTVVGWTGFNALALIISNAWGLKDGEWTGFENPKKVLLFGNLILIISWVVIGYTNGMLQ